MGTKGTYNVENYMQQTQNGIGDGLLSLTQRSDLCADSQDRKGEIPASLRTVRFPDKNANPVHSAATENRGDDRVPGTVDFLSIFAADNLVSDDVITPDPHDGTPSWTRTLPSSFRKKKAPERPRTLTPPCQPSRKRFRKRDWKFYVHGKYKTLIPVQQKQEYGFQPVPTQDTYITFGVFKQVAKDKKASISSQGNSKVSNSTTDVCDNVVVKNSGKLRTLTHQQLLENTPKVVRTRIDAKTLDIKSSDLENSNVEIRLEPLQNFTKPSAFHKVSANLTSGSVFRPVMNGAQSSKPPFASNDSTATVSSISINSALSEQVTANGLYYDTSSTDVASLNDELLAMETTPKAPPGICKNPLPIGTNVPGPHVVKPKATAARSPPVPIQHNGVPQLTASNNAMQNEGTMTSLNSESSTSDGYHRESSLSPTTPDYRQNPHLPVPPQAVNLDKHEVKLQAVGRHKSAAEKRQKKSRSKSRDKKRDASPSKTERSASGKVSCATQTHKSIKNSKYGAKGEPHAVLPEPPVRKPIENKLVSDTGDPFVDLHITHPLPNPVAKRSGTDSSTSSDECSDSYKKVNMHALRERFLQNRERTKNEAVKKSQEQSQESTIEITVINGCDPAIAAEISGSNIESSENDILENDMYSVDDDGDATPVAEVTGKCACMSTPQQCDYCQILQARRLQYEEQMSTSHKQQHQLRDRYKAFTTFVHEPSADRCLRPKLGSKSSDSKFESEASLGYSGSSFVPPESSRGPVCLACNDKCQNVEPDDSVVIPPREQRRIRTKPVMPVIVEDQLRSEGESKRTRSTADSSSASSSLDRTLDRANKKTNVLVVQKQAKVPTSPGAASTGSLRSVSSNASNSSENAVDSSMDMDNTSKTVSLLDRMHKKHYPSHYTAKPVTDPEKVKVVLSPVTSHRPLDLQKREPPIDLKAKSALTFAAPKKSPNPEVKVPLTVTIPGEGHDVTSLMSPPLSPRLPGQQRMSPRLRSHTDDGKPLPSPSQRSKQSTSSVSTNSKSCENSPVSPAQSIEIEAIEACKWLRAAGFPQYAQMYEDQLFPIDIGSVQKDHDFLDQDSIQSLFRRLNTLNKCAVMKIDAPPRKNNEDSDEEEQCALSDKWKYTRSSRRWSRKDLDLSDLVPGSQDSLLGDNAGKASHCDSSSVPNKNSDDMNSSEVTPQVEIHVNDKPKVNLFDNRDRSKAKVTNGVLCVTSEPSESSPTLRRVSSEKIAGAKSFFKRIESLKGGKKPKKPSKMLYPPGAKLEIGEPVVVNSHAMKERMDKLGCRDISPKSDTSQLSIDVHNTSEELNSSCVVTDSSDTSPSVAGDGRKGAENRAPSTSTTESDESLVVKPKQSDFCRKDSNDNSIAASTPIQRSSELEEIIFALGSSEPLVQNFPKVVTNGYISMENGGQINCRTGSFNMGSQELAEGRVTPRSTRASSEEVPPLRRKIYTPKPQCRLSVYDNIQIGDNVDPQEELDKILADLMENISGLDQSLGETTPTDSVQGSGILGPALDSGSRQEEPLAKLLKECNVQTNSAGVAVGSPARAQNLQLSCQAGKDTYDNQNKKDIKDTHSGSPFKTNSSSSYSPCRKDSNSRTQHRQPMVDSVQQPDTNSVTSNDPQPDNVNTSNVSSVTQNVTSATQDVTTVTLEQLSHDMVASGVMAERGENIPSTSRDVDSPLEGDECEEEEGEEEEEEVRSVTSSCSHHDDVTDDDEAETAGSREDDSSDHPEVRERRDSGVGSSLTRAPSDRRRHRIRWHSFVKSHRPSLNSENLQVASMSAGQLMVLRKLCLLKVTSLMEKYSPSNRSGWNWAVPKFIKRFKAPDYKDKNVFGVPLLVVLQRTGQPLPQCMLYAMRCLRRTAMDAVGIFRKSGVRSRIQKLRDQVESDQGQHKSVDFESLQPYDVADLIKQYFRELPECLLTNKLSETFISIFTYVPADERTEALQCTCMLLPDENREVLQSLLLFLSDMASHSDQNQMTASNLAVCFAPSLFHMFGHNPSSSPKRGRKSTGIPDAKELQDQKAAHECLTAMITEGRKLFMVPEDLLSKCRFSYIEQGDPVPLEELGRKRSSEDVGGDHSGYMESCIQGLLKESRDKFKGWMSVPCHFAHIDLAYKKVGDGHPLRLWKCSVDVEAPPVEVLNRVLRERHLWDVDLLEWRVIEKLDSQTEVFQSIVNSMAPHPTRDFIELRSWRTQLPKGACVLVSTSVEHKGSALLGGIRAVILASRYLIEPCGAGKSRLTHICRIDIRGHTPEWYNKGYGHICANYIGRIRDSFKQTLAETDGPETKI